MEAYGMIKTASPAGWDFGGGPNTQLLKLSSRGLRGHDRGEFIKRAGYSMLPFLEAMKELPGEKLAHTIAVGAHEGWGFNRNGDGFKCASCEKYHKTFEKFARAYRNHKNKNPAESYGTIKLALWNEPMKRIELVTSYNADKAAADRNGGLIADKELEKLARGDDIAGSMACRVSHDVCSFCGNQARTRDNYCKQASCGAGGCKDNLTKLVKIGNDYHHLGVYNPHPAWFDWSHVFRPADRTAWGGSADYLTKAAEDMGFFKEGSAVVESQLQLAAPLSVVLFQDQFGYGNYPSWVEAQIKLASGMLDLLNNPKLVLGRDVKRAFDQRLRSGINVDKFPKPGTTKMAEAMTALAAEKIVLPVSEFAKLSQREGLAKQAQAAIPEAFASLAVSPNLYSEIQSNKYACDDRLPSVEMRKLAASLRDYTLDDREVAHRCTRSIARQYALSDTTPVFEKDAADAADAKALARDYALYQLAALAKIAADDNDFLLTSRLAVAQNTV